MEQWMTLYVDTWWFALIGLLLPFIGGMLFAEYGYWFMPIFVAGLTALWALVYYVFTLSYPAFAGVAAIITVTILFFIVMNHKANLDTMKKSNPK